MAYQNGPKISILSPGYPDTQFEEVIRALNGSNARVPVSIDDSRWELKQIDASEMRVELRRLISEWQSSGPNLLKLFKKNPDLEESCTRGRTFLIPTREGSAQLAWLPDRVPSKLSQQKERALTLFSQFLVNPKSMDLGGPCARCDNFYVKKTKRQKVYCTTDCGRAKTALSATQRRRQEEKAKKLLKAQQSIEKCSTVLRQMHWEKYVIGKTGFTQKWLTRMVGEGKLIPPVDIQRGKQINHH